MFWNVPIHNAPQHSQHQHGFSTPYPHKHTHVPLQSRPPSAEGTKRVPQSSSLILQTSRWSFRVYIHLWSRIIIITCANKCHRLFRLSYLATEMSPKNSQRSLYLKKIINNTVKFKAVLYVVYDVIGLYTSASPRHNLISNLLVL